MAGVEPWDYSLEEIYWMAKAKRLEEWDRVAWLCFWIPRFSNKKFSVEDFQPMRSQSKQMSITKFIATVEAMKAYLPDTLTESEIEDRWRKYYNAKCK